jgi:hypothetical protein
MRNNRLSITIAFLISSSLTVWIYSNTSQKAFQKKLSITSEAMDSPDEYEAFEKTKYADPNTGEIPENIRVKELEFARSIPKVELSRSFDFIHRGPFNVGGRTRAYACDITNPNILIAGSVSGGIYRSTDAGNSWLKSTVPIFYQGITCITQDTRTGNTNKWYAGTGEAYGQSASADGAYYLGNGFYKSTDNGVSWDTIASTASNTPQTFDSQNDLIWKIVLDNNRLDSTILYAACYGGIFRSNNEGVSWKLVLGSFGSTDSYFTDVNISNSGKIYATLSDDGANKGVWFSNNGLIFTNILPNNFPTSYNRIVSGIAPSNDSIVYFAANTPNFGTPDTNYIGDVEWNSFYKYTYLGSDSSGVNGIWEDLSANLPTNGGPFDKYTVQGSYDMVIAVKPDDPNFVILGGTNLYRSTDGFSSPNNTRFIGGYEEGIELPVIRGYKNHHPDQHVLFFHPTNSNILYSGNDGGVYRTDNISEVDTIHWTTLNKGYLTTQFYTLAIDQSLSNDPVIIAGAQDNGTWFTNSTNSNHTWVQPRGGDGSYCAIAANKEAYYFSIQNGKIQRAIVDANGNVGAYARIDPIAGRGYQFINPFILDPTDNNKMYVAGGQTLWRNNDLASIPMVNNWDSIPNGWQAFPDTVSGNYGKISALACSVSPAHTLYYGTEKKRVYKIENANTGSPTRTDITTTGFPAGANVSCIAVDPQDANKVLVVFSNYGVYSLFYSINGGTNWIRVAGNLEASGNGSGNGPSCRWASIMHVNDGVVYILATSTGVYATDTLINNGTMWVQQGTETIGNSVCDYIVTRESDGLVVVGTHGNGIFSTNISSVNDILSNNSIKEKSTLDFEVSPNPGNGKATLIFNESLSKSIKINIINSIGKYIYSIDKQLSNINSISIDISNYTSGIYFIKVSDGKETITKKYLKL